MENGEEVVELDGGDVYRYLYGQYGLRIQVVENADRPSPKCHLRRIYLDTDVISRTTWGSSEAPLAAPTFSGRDQTPIRRSMPKHSVVMEKCFMERTEQPFWQVERGGRYGLVVERVE